MANFDNYTNYKNNAGVSGVIFGADSAVLEVELNEMQEIQTHYVREFFKSFVGNGISDISKLTYSDGKVKIANGCDIICDGYLIKADGMEFSIADGIAYLWIWEEEADYNSTLHVEGNFNHGSRVSNWMKDGRATNETTRRKVVRYQLTDTIPSDSKYSYVAIAKIIGKQMIKLINEIGNIDHTAEDIYGVEVDWVNNTSIRLAGSIGKIGGTDHNDIMAFNRRKCNVTADGTVTAYYGDANYTESGKTSDGTLVQVMVEQNKFYYKVVPLKLEKINDGVGYKVRKARYYISDTPKDGFKVHPAFIRNNIEVDKIYVASYKSAIRHNDNTITDTFANLDTDKLISCAGYIPTVGRKPEKYGVNLIDMRRLASNIGDNWQLKDFTIMNMDILLFLVEYATLNIQNAIGPGYTAITGGEDVNASALTGSTSHIGNGTGCIDKTGKTSIIYRGEEDIFGSAWEHIEGLFVYRTKSQYLWTNDNFNSINHGIDNPNNNYKSCGFSAPIFNSQSGYITAFGYSEDCDFSFIPVETDTNPVQLPDGAIGDHMSIQDVGDANYMNARYGGSWDGRTNCGLCAINLGFVGIYYHNVGGRLAYIPVD